jgi:hypothetical protein
VKEELFIIFYWKYYNGLKIPNTSHVECCSLLVRKEKYKNVTVSRESFPLERLLFYSFLFNYMNKHSKGKRRIKGCQDKLNKT